MMNFEFFSQNKTQHDLTKNILHFTLITKKRDINH